MGVHDPQMLEIQLPNVRMRALAWGPADGRLALCLHGFPDSAHGWRLLGPMLAEHGMRVVAPFTRGYFPTEPATDGDYHMGALVADALALHEHLDGGDDAILIGHDWGAWTANAIAALPASPFAAHISLALPPVRAIDRSAHSRRRKLAMAAIQLRMSWYILFFQIPARPQRVLHRVIPRLWRDWSPPAADISAGVADALNALPTTAHREAAVGYYRAMFRPSRPAERYAGLHRYRLRLPTVPMLLLHGRQDGAMQADYTRNLTNALPPGTRLEIIENAGHFLQLDQPTAVRDSILKYLATPIAVEPTGPYLGRAVGQDSQVARS